MKGDETRDPVVDTDNFGSLAWPQFSNAIKKVEATKDGLLVVIEQTYSTGHTHISSFIFLPHCQMFRLKGAACGRRVNED